ncbi:MAG: ABC transporter ATP-binding protein [Pseudomonadota bacterium]
MSGAARALASVEAVTPVLSARGLAFRFEGADRPVFADADLDVTPGEFVALVGGSGVGKSTLLRCLADLVKPERGTVSLSTEARAGTRGRAMVFQDGRLLPWFTLAANVGYGLEGLGLTREEKQARVADALALTGLADLGDRFPHQLSGGQQQRAGIARALCVRPDVLLMDEPFSAVDAITRVGLQDELARLHEATGTAIVFVTHDLDEAVLLADRVLVMRKGGDAPARIVADHTVEVARPRRRDDAALVRAAEALRAEL